MRGYKVDHKYKQNTVEYLVQMSIEVYYMVFFCFNRINASLSLFKEIIIENIS